MQQSATTRRTSGRDCGPRRCKPKGRARRVSPVHFFLMIRKRREHRRQRSRL